MFKFRKCGRQRVIPIIKTTSKKAKTLKHLRSFLDVEEPQAVRWLLSVWDKQRATVTYKELREAVLSGGMSEKQLQKWQEDYATLINTKLAPQWEKAMAAAAKAMQAEFPYFLYDPVVNATQEYIRQHGAQLVTSLIAEQKNAIQAMVAQAAHYEAVTADSLSHMIRPVIGLTKPQTVANLNYYNGVLDALKKAHPRMTQESADKKAREAAAKYAAKQHRYRAQNIARTELAFAYNQGSYRATLDAQEKGYIGDCKKVWLTADDERVCLSCGGSDGESVNMNSMFSIGVLLPPAHPSCRCAVAYEEIEPPYIVDNQPEVLYNVTELEKYYSREDVQIIKGILEKANKDAVAVWNKYGDKIKFDNISNDNASYHPLTKGVTLNLSQEFDNPRGPYGTTFHELGHLFDNISCTGTQYTSAKVSSFRDKLYQDYSNYESYTRELMKQAMRKKPKIDDVREFISRTLESYEGTASGVSDIISGITHNKVKGLYSHQNTYWNKNPYNLPIEAFAQMYQASILDSHKELIMKEYFPMAYNEFLDILKGMVK